MIDMETVADPQRGRRQNTKQEFDENDDADIEEDDDVLDNSISEPDLWQITGGSFVMFAGVVLPVLLITAALSLSFEGVWRLMLLHPIETLLEGLLVLSVPAANYLAWNSICHNDGRRPIRLGILNGVAIAVPAIACAVSIASFALAYPLVDSLTQASHGLSIGLLGVISFPALIAALYLTHCLRKSKHTRDAKIRTIVYSLMGVGLTLVSLFGAEFRSSYIRIAESMSLSDDAKEKETGLSMLRSVAPEKELKMVCADAHTAGLSGMFLPLDLNTQKRLYFAATGKPYRDRQSTNMSLMSNDYLRNHVVGAPVEGLSLCRSAIFGKVHTKTLSSTLNWTFVFKNKTYVNQEARAELSLPEGAVISDLTLWINGEPRSGAFSATEQAAGAYKWITVQHRDPALITDLGRGRYLLQASPVPGQGEMKVQVSITEPLKLDGSNKASFGMPRFIDSNFALSGEHSLTLRSNESLSTSLGTVKAAVTTDGDNILSGRLKEEDISNSAFTVKLDKPVDFKSVLVKDAFGSGMVFEQLKTRSANAPKHLVVVVDSSQSMQGKINEVVDALEKIPSQIDTSILLAGDNESTEPVGRVEGIKRLKENNYGGGQDNLHALVKAAEKAGQSTGGAVLWIHGPQPGYNNEMYIMAPYAVQPSFFELALDDCLTDANEFFKNHRDIGPFTAIPRSGPVIDDLKNFLSKWQPGAQETYMELSDSPDGPFVNQLSDKDESRELSILSAAHRVQKLLASGKKPEAAALGVRYHIVTPVSGAIVLENANDYRKFGMEPPQGTPKQSGTDIYIDGSDASQTAASGATNGVISPQPMDSSVVMGINTTGTVRVNNLANLEALLNIFANGGEILGIFLGAANVIFGAMGKTMSFPFRLSSKGRIALGIAMALIGLALPGCLNWLVASARDANLFD